MSQGVCQCQSVTLEDLNVSSGRKHKICLKIDASFYSVQLQQSPVCSSGQLGKIVGCDINKTVTLFLSVNPHTATRDIFSLLMSSWMVSSSLPMCCHLMLAASKASYFSFIFKTKQNVCPV